MEGCSTVTRYNKPQRRWKGVVLSPDFSLSIGVMHLLRSRCGQHTYTIIVVVEKNWQVKYIRGSMFGHHDSVRSILF